MKTSEDFLNGKVLLIDKPLNWTSFQVVNKLRWAIRQHFGLKKIKVGHAGTLDPLASGLLIICTGKFTKKISTFQNQTKEYIGTVSLGATTPSYDLESEINARFETSHINIELITQTLKDFIGEIDQKPPIFSAIKKDGRRLYELARAGEEVDIPSRKIHIQEIEVLDFSNDQLKIRIVCSKGTYIRSLAHDIGTALSSGAHLSALRRTKIGEYKVDDALEIKEFIEELGFISPDFLT